MPVETLAPRAPHIEELTPQLNRPENSLPFTSNGYLRHVVSQLSQIKPDWEKLFTTFQQTSEVKKIRDYNDLSLPGSLLEIHLDLSLQALADCDPNIITRPFPKHLETRDHVFRHGIFGGSINASAKIGELQKEVTLAEYDSIILLGDLPVLFETKLTKNTMNGINGGLNASMREKQLEKRLAPLRDLFGSFGYVVLSNPEVINSVSATQQRFQENGGVLQALPISYEDFVKSSLEYREDFLQTKGKETIIFPEEPEYGLEVA